jgi:hypothetical protein
MSTVAKIFRAFGRLSEANREDLLSVSELLRDDIRDRLRETPRLRARLGRNPKIISAIGKVARRSEVAARHLKEAFSNDDRNGMRGGLQGGAAA